MNRKIVSDQIYAGIFKTEWQGRVPSEPHPTDISKRLPDLCNVFRAELNAITGAVIKSNETITKVEISLATICKIYVVWPPGYRDMRDR